MSRFRYTNDSKSLYRKSHSRGLFPQHGAIFMASNSTRKECFERQLFGLPCDHADFVMEVKKGMLLFLYDFQEKNLYGVFEATSNGAMNIVPHAYKKTSPKKFPAQVRFTTFWHCDPIPEHAFCGAIKENYYTKSKFNFGLSRSQVERLLSLYEKRLLKIPRSPSMERQCQRSSQIDESVVVTHPGSLETSESITKSVIEPIPEILDNVKASDHGIASQLEDYIPLPSIEPEEFEVPFDAFLWGGDSFASRPFAEADGTENGEQINSGTAYDFQGWDSFALLPCVEVNETDNAEQIDNGSRYDFQGRDSVNSKPANCSSEPEENITQEDLDPNGLEVQGLYADTSNRRTSVFMRLSGEGNVMVEESFSNSKADNLRNTLKELDTRHEPWCQSKCEENVLKPRTSVFSRLTNGAGARNSLDHKSKVRIVERNLKCKNNCSFKTHEKDSDKRLQRTHSKHCSQETKACRRTHYKHWSQ